MNHVTMCLAAPNSQKSRDTRTAFDRSVVVCSSSLDEAGYGGGSEGRAPFVIYKHQKWGQCSWKEETKRPQTPQKMSKVLLKVSEEQFAAREWRIRREKCTNSHWNRRTATKEFGRHKSRCHRTLQTLRCSSVMLESLLGQTALTQNVLEGWNHRGTCDGTPRKPLKRATCTVLPKLSAATRWSISGTF